VTAASALWPLLACLAFALAAPAHADDRSDGDLNAIKADTALLLIAIHSNAKFETLVFNDAAREEIFEIDDVREGRQLVLVKVPAGSYYLQEVKLDDGKHVLFAPQERNVPKFVLRERVLNYAGELRVDSKENRVSVAFGGNAFDALPTLLRRERGIAPDLLQRHRFAFATPLDGAKLAGSEPDPAWRYADWLGRIPRVDEAQHRELALAVLTRFGATLPAADLAWDESKPVLDKLSKRRAQAWYSPQKDEVFISLDGLWGLQGQALAFELLFVDGRLAHVAVRGSVAGDLWGLPDADAWEDLAEYARAAR
jgi:hypothetical protein